MARLSCIVTIISIALVLVLVCVSAEKELYSNQYDDVDVEGIFKNDKLRKQYYNCFMETGPCRTADAKFFKDMFGEALQTQCRKCTEKQKEHLDFIVDWYTTNKPEEWQALVAKTINDVQKKRDG